MDKSALAKLRGIVDPRYAKPGYAQRRGMERKKEILKFVSVNPGATPYSIAKALYGKPGDPKAAAKSFKALKQQLDQLEGIEGLFTIEEINRGRHFVLTEEGKTACETFGVLMPSSRAGEIVSALNKFATEELLSVEEMWAAEKLLTDNIIEAMDEIIDNYRRDKSLDDWRSQNEDPMPRTGASPTKAFGFPKKLSPAYKFITAMAILRRECEYKSMVKERLDKSGEKLMSTTDRFKKRVGELTATGKTGEEAEQEAIDQLRTQLPFFNDEHTYHNLERISCGLPFLWRGEALFNRLVELEKWFISYMKKCDWLIAEYIWKVEEEAVRRICQYNRFRALEDLARIQRSIREKARAKKKD